MEENNEYEYIYGVSIFTNSSGTEKQYIQNNGLYFQTFGGGAEGGYVLTPENKIYKVERNWGKCFKMELLDNHKIICLEDEPDNIRVVDISYLLKETEYEIDYDCLWENYTDEKLEIYSMLN